MKESILEGKLRKYNTDYRNGNPSISDEEYDNLIDLLKSINPNNSFLQKLEEEVFKNKVKIKHKKPMLSIDKAYTEKDLGIYIGRLKKAVKFLDLDNSLNGINIHVNSKLDGVAGFYDNGILSSRGDGYEGFDITNIFELGVVNIAEENNFLSCYGEIVISKSYFENNLSEVFKHPRNMISGLLSSDKLNPLTKKALKDKAISFVPYSVLPEVIIPLSDFHPSFINNLDPIKKIIKVDYPTDGLVCTIDNYFVIDYLGHNERSYKYQIAIKDKSNTKLSIVKDIKWEVGRTGNITPIIHIKPIDLSGSVIKKVSGYNCGYIENNKISIGAVVEIIRSGEVIPKIVSIVEPSKEPIIIPYLCPECNNTLIRVNDMLKCSNVKCKQRVVKNILQQIKNNKIKLFGKKTIEKIVDSGYDTYEDILEMTHVDFIHCGFGEVLSNNLYNSIKGVIDENQKTILVK